MAAPAALGAIAGAAGGNLLGPVSYGAGCVAWSAMPIKYPSPDDTLRLAAIGRATNQEVKTTHNIEGYAFDYTSLFNRRTRIGESGLLEPDLTVYARFGKLNERIALVNSPIPTPDECITLYTRKLISRDLAKHWLSIHYRGDHALVDTLLQTQYQIPGASDLVRFAVREAFDPDTIVRYGYHKEFPREILGWMEKQGYGQDIGMPRPVGSTDNVGNAMGGNATWSDLYWYSHWELPSLTQGYEMLHRLYPASRYGPAPDAVGGNTFSSDDLSALQKAQDIPEYWRSRLQAISYNPPTRVDTKRMYFDGIISKGQVYHSLRASGYNDTDANNMTNWMEFQKDNANKKGQKAQASEYVCKHLSIGTITQEKAREILTQAGYDGVASQRLIDKCILDIQTETLKVVIHTLREHYHLGKLSDDEAIQQLRTARVSEVMIEQYLYRWRYERDFRYRDNSLGELSKAFKRGIITEDDLLNSLTNLGYKDREKYIFVTNLKTDMIQGSIKAAKRQYAQLQAANKANAKLAAKAAKDAVDKAKKQIKYQESVQAKKLRGLVAAASDKNIENWYSQDMITLEDIALRYLLKFWSIPDIQRRLFDIDNTLTSEVINGAIKKAETTFVKLGYAKPIEPTNPIVLPAIKKSGNMSGKGKQSRKDTGGKSADGNTEPATE